MWNLKKRKFMIAYYNWVNYKKSSRTTEQMMYYRCLWGVRPVVSSSLPVPPSIYSKQEVAQRKILLCTNEFPFLHFCASIETFKIFISQVEINVSCILEGKIKFTAWSLLECHNIHLLTSTNCIHSHCQHLK